MKSKQIAALLIGIGLAPLHAQFRPRHFKLGAGEVAHILAHSFADRGVQISESQVSLPADVIASDPEPALEIRSIESLGHLPANRAGEVSSAVKLACKLPGTCLPFYAIVSTQEESAKLGGSSAVQAHAPAAHATPATYTMKAGTRATLVLDDQSTHIRMSVISLENGVAGHTIRVSSTDHKQVYQAEVVSADLLKGAF